MCISIPNTKCVQKLKWHFLKSKVDEIWYEERGSGKVNAHFLRIMLKIISTEIISIYSNFDLFFFGQE